MMNYVENELKIRDFWSWFLKNENQFKEVKDAKAAIEALNNQILSFGLFSWEIGEGNEKPYYLAISPNNDKNRLRLSKMIVDLAPDLPDWEFYFTKKPIEWDFILEMYDPFGIKQSYNTADWEYTLIEKPNGKIDLHIFAENIHALDMEDQLIGADVAVIRIIGEENRINYVEAIKLVIDFEPEQEEYVYYLTDLKAEFDDLFKDVIIS